MILFGKTRETMINSIIHIVFPVYKVEKQIII